MFVRLAGALSIALIAQRDEASPLGQMIRANIAVRPHFRLLTNDTRNYSKGSAV